MSPSLHELQSWMKKILVDPRGASAALLESSPESYENKWIETIVSDEKYSNSNRLDIYAEAYFSRILEAFSIDFPITKEILGEDQFAKLVADYLKKYPSTQYNLNNVGVSITVFIKTYTKNSVIQDVINLESLAIQSFYAPMNGPIDVAQLGQLTPMQWENIKFELDPSIYFIQSSWPLEAIWKKELKGTIKENLTLTHYCLRRVNSHVELAAISATEFGILHELRNGRELSNIGQSYDDKDVSHFFSQWIQNNFFANFYF